MHGSKVVTVKIIRPSGESEGTLSYRTSSPWKIVESDPEGPPKPFHWEVVSQLPETIEPHLLFFESRTLAERWAATDPRARGFDWTGLDPPAQSTELSTDSELAHSYSALAAENGVPPESPKAFELAREAGLLNTLVLYDEYGGNKNNQAPLPVPAPNLWGLPWMPKSCRSVGSTYLYGRDKKQIQVLQATAQTVRDCVPGALYARTT